MQKWKLTDDAVLGNAFVFLLAGYETTSTALGFTAWLLAKHRDVQERLQKEIDEKVTDKVSPIVTPIFGIHFEHLWFNLGRCQLRFVTQITVFRCSLSRSITSLSSRSRVSYLDSPISCIDSDKSDQIRFRVCQFFRFLTRTCVKECDVGPIHFVPGVQVNIPTREIHNDPDVWPEPEKFDPDRLNQKIR